MVPLWPSDGVGEPVVVTVKEPAMPMVKTVLYALVIAGVCPVAVLVKEKKPVEAPVVLATTL